MRVVLVGRGVTGGADRGVDLAGTRVSLDLLNLVLEAAHFATLVDLVNDLPLLFHLRNNELLVNVRGRLRIV